MRRGAKNSSLLAYRVISPYLVSQVSKVSAPTQPIGISDYWRWRLLGWSTWPSLQLLRGVHGCCPQHRQVRDLRMSSRPLRPRNDRRLGLGGPGLPWGNCRLPELWGPGLPRENAKMSDITQGWNRSLGRYFWLTLYSLTPVEVIISCPISTEFSPGFPTSLNTYLVVQDCWLRLPNRPFSTIFPPQQQRSGFIKWDAFIGASDENNNFRPKSLSRITKIPINLEMISRSIQALLHPVARRVATLTMAPKKLPLQGEPWKKNRSKWAPKEYKLGLLTSQNFSKSDSLSGAVTNLQLTCDLKAAQSNDAVDFRAKVSTEWLIWTVLLSCKSTSEYWWTCLISIVVGQPASACIFWSKCFLKCIRQMKVMNHFHPWAWMFEQNATSSVAIKDMRPLSNRRFLFFPLCGQLNFLSTLPPNRKKPRHLQGVTKSCVVTGSVGNVFLWYCQFCSKPWR